MSSALPMALPAPSAQGSAPPKVNRDAAPVDSVDIDVASSAPPSPPSGQHPESKPPLSPGTAGADADAGACRADVQGGPQVWRLVCVCGAEQRGEPSLPVTLQPSDAENPLRRRQLLVAKLKERGWTCP